MRGLRDGKLRLVLDISKVDLKNIGTGIFGAAQGINCIAVLKFLNSDSLELLVNYLVSQFEPTCILVCRFKIITNLVTSSDCWHCCAVCIEWAQGIICSWY